MTLFTFNNQSKSKYTTNGKDQLQSIERYLLLFIVLASFLLIFIIPPFQKTDEVSNYLATLSATSKLFTGENQLKKAYAFLPQSLLADYVNEKHSRRFPVSLLTETDYSFEITQIEEQFLPSIIYLPQAVLLWPLMAINTPPVLVFYLARLIFWMIGIALVLLSYRLIPEKFRLLLLGYLVLPMVLIQLGSINKEVLHLGFTALAISIFFKLHSKYQPKWLFAMIFAMTISIIARPFYFPLFFFMLLISLPKLTLFKFGLICLSISIPAIFYFTKINLFHAPVINEQGVSAYLQLIFLQKNPSYFLTTLISSYHNHIWAYFKSLIGTYGSIHYYLDFYIYAFFGGWLLALILHYSQKENLFSLKETIFLGLGIISVILIAFFLMLLYATPVGYHYIIDVQGRYFISLLPIIIILLAKLIYNLKYKLFLIGLITVFIFLVKDSYNRYFDYSQGFYYQDYEFLSDQVKKLKTGLLLPSQTITVQNPQAFQVQLDEKQKLMGLSVIEFDPENKIHPPLKLEVKDADCQTFLTSSLITTHTNGATNHIDVLFSHPITAHQHVCVIIEPLSTNLENSQPPQLLLDPKQVEQKNIFAMPLYAF